MSIPRLFTIILIALLVLCAEVFAVVPPFTTISFEWERAPSHTPFTEFAIKWGSSTNSASTNYYNNIKRVGTATQATIDNMTSGYLYFVVVALNGDIESLPSNTVSITNHPAAPLQLRMTTNTTTSLRIEGTTDANNWIHLATIETDDSPAMILPGRKSMMIRAVKLPPLP